MQVVQWVRYAIGFVFISSGIVKLIIPSFVDNFTQLGMPFPVIFLLVLANVEILCGTLMILNLYVRQVTITLAVIMIGALVVAKLPVLMDNGISLFVFESRLDITMLILLAVVWRYHEKEKLS